MTTPKPKLDLFEESTYLVAKKCRTSTPSLRPPKAPTKSSKRKFNNSISASYYSSSSFSSSSTNNNNNNNNYHNNSFSAHDGSFSYDLSRCSILHKNFDEISEIGSGHFADVSKARSKIDRKYYAIKKTSIPFTSNSDRLRKLQEVRNHQSLPPHPNCVRYHGSWEEDGCLYIQTELCKISLNKILEKEHKLSEQKVWKYLLDLLLAVKHLHDHDLLHLDIKPDNILISSDDVAKLGDFGLMCNCSDLNSSMMSTSTSTPTPPPLPATTSTFTATTTTSTTTTTHPVANATATASKIPRITEDFNKSSASTSQLTDWSFDDDAFNHQPLDHDDSGILNRSDESIDSIDEGDSKYLARETMQGKFTKAADIFSLGITIFEAASGLELPTGGGLYHKLRHNEIDDLYFNGLSADLVRVIKMMMEEDYTKRPTIDDLLQLDAVRARRFNTSKNYN